MAKKKGVRGVGSYIFYTLLTAALGTVAGLGVAYFGGEVRRAEGITDLALGSTLEVKVSDYLTPEQYTTLGKYTLRAENAELVEVLHREEGNDQIRAIGVGSGKLSVYNENEELIATIPYQTKFNSTEVRDKILYGSTIGADDKYTAAELRTIKELSLSDCEITNFGDIPMLTGLETLALRDCGVHSIAYTAETVPASCVNLFGMKNLKEVNFANNTLENIDALNNCTSLTNIIVSDNMISEYTVGLESLKYIDFTGNNMLLQNEKNEILHIASDKQANKVIETLPYSYKVCSSAAEVAAFLQSSIKFAPYVDMTAFTDKEQIIIPENRDVVYFEGQAGADDYQLSFAFTQRETATLSFYNVSIAAEGVVDFSNVQTGALYFNQICDWASTTTEEAVIKANDLQIYCEEGALVTISGANAKAIGIQNKGNGGVGIRAKNVSIEAGDNVEMIVQGGNGANGQVSDAGMDGTNGKRGTDSYDVDAEMAVGGKGTKGQSGKDGGVGGNGNAAIYLTDAESEVFTKTATADAQIKFIGGNGGKGGTGGKGGNGGNGGMGGSLTLMSSDTPTHNVYGGVGGNGGDGGDGGDGGAGGNASVAIVRVNEEYSHSASYNGQVGAGGEGGVGGEGGKGGDGGNGYSTEYGYAGRDVMGATGADGAVGENGYVGESGKISWIVEETEEEIPEQEPVSSEEIASNEEESA